MSGLPGYFVEADHYGEPWIWRKGGDYPVAVLTARTLLGDPELWGAIVALVEGPKPACEWCGDDFDPADSPCVHLSLCAPCASDCPTCRIEDPRGPDDDDRRYELERDERP